MTLPSTSDQLTQIDSHKGAWTLAEDNALCSALDSFTTELISRLDENEKLIEKTAIDVGRSSVRIAQLNTQLSAYKSNRFIENRVHDDLPSHTQTAVADTETTSSTSGKQQETIAAIKEAVAIGYKVIDNAYKKIDCSPEDFEAGHSFVPDPIYEPLDPYLSRPLPFLIGSKQFMQSAYIGLIEQDDSKNQEKGEQIVIDLPVSLPPTFEEKHLPVVRKQSAQSSKTSSLTNADNQADLEANESSRTSVNLSDQESPNPVTSCNHLATTARVISQLSDSESDSSDSLFGSSPNRVKSLSTPREIHPQQNFEEIIKKADAVRQRSSQPVAKVPQANASQKETVRRNSVSSSKRNAQSPLPAARQVSTNPTSKNVAKETCDSLKVQPSIVSPPSPAKPLLQQHRLSPAGSTQAVPTQPRSSSIFDESDSDSDLFASAARRPPVQRPKLNALISESSTALGRSSATKVDSALNNRSASVTPTAKRSSALSKPSQSLFDESSDSDEDLFASSSQNMKFPFGLGRKKSSTPNVSSKEAAPKTSEEQNAKGEDHKALISLRKDNTLTDQTNTSIETKKDQLAKEEQENREIEENPLPPERAPAASIAIDDPLKAEVMSSTSRASNGSTLKVKSKANDLFAAKLSAALGQGPPQLKPPKKAEAKEEQTTPKAEVNNSTPVDLSAARDNQNKNESNNLGSILKGRPKGPANRRPKSAVRPLEEIQAEQKNIAPENNGTLQTTEIQQSATTTEKSSLSQVEKPSESPSAPLALETSNKLEANTPNTKTNVSVTAKQKAFFDDSDDDLFASNASRKTVKEVAAERSQPTSGISQKTHPKATSTGPSGSKTVPAKKPGLFDDSDSDSDLFK